MNGIETVKKLKPCEFKYKNTPEFGLIDDKIHIGFIAQELAKVFDPYKYGIVVEREGYLSVNYHELIAVLVKAIQEQQEKIEVLEKKLNG